MKKFYELYGKYLWIDIQGNKIVNANCTCNDFGFRRLTSKDGKVSLISFCKHLKRLVNIYYGELEVEIGVNKNNT